MALPGGSRYGGRNTHLLATNSAKHLNPNLNSTLDLYNTIKLANPKICRHIFLKSTGNNLSFW